MLLAAVVLVGGANVASYAATGDHFLLGKTNTASKASVLENTGSGPALELRTGSAAAPFAVTSKKTVKKLSADLVDGKDSRTFMNPGHRYTLTSGVTNDVLWGFPDLPKGVYQASFTILGQTGGDPIACGFLHEDATFDAATYGSLAGSWSSTTASVVLDLRSDSVVLRCFNSSGFQVPDTASSNATSVASFAKLTGVAERTPMFPMPRAGAPRRFGR